MIYQTFLLHNGFLWRFQFFNSFTAIWCLLNHVDLSNTKYSLSVSVSTFVQLHFTPVPMFLFIAFLGMKLYPHSIE